MRFHSNLGPAERLTGEMNYGTARRRLSLAAALALPRTSERCLLTAILRCGSPHGPPTAPQVPHPRDELYFVAAGTARYRGQGDSGRPRRRTVLRRAAHVAHRFEDISADSSGCCSTGRG